MVQFEFATANRIVFGAGMLQKAGALARESGTCALVVTGAHSERAQPLLKVLAEAGIQCPTFAVGGEPEVGTVQKGVAEAKKLGCDMVISFGGGSAIDAGKAIAAMLTNPGDLHEYLEVIGQGRALTKAPAPFIAIPTTAGTGSEVTRNAVLAAPEHRVKVSLRSALMLPRAAIVDPELTYDLPAEITARTGLDALTQLIEPYVSPRANPMTDAICLEGLRRVERSLLIAGADGHNRAAREDMAMASLFGGLALANAGLGAVHGLAGPLGGMFPSAPHGALCAALLPQVFQINLNALNQRQPNSPSLKRFGQVARVLTSNRHAQACTDWLRGLISHFRIPGLRAYGVQREQFEEIAAKAARSSSMKANPIALSAEELTQVLEQSF